MRPPLRILATAGLLSLSFAHAEGTITPAKVFTAVRATDAVCRVLGCWADTKYPPNAFAAVLGLPAFNQDGDEYSTVGGDWVFHLRSSGSGGWSLRLEPLSGQVAQQDQLRFPEARRPAMRPPLAAPAKPPTAKQPFACTVAVDVRGLKGDFQAAMTSYVFDESGAQLWPDAALVQGVDSELVNEGNLQAYVRNEADLARYPNVTKVKAAKVLPPKGTQTKYDADAVLSSAEAIKFKAAGKACRVVYVLPVK